MDAGTAVRDPFPWTYVPGPRARHRARDLATQTVPDSARAARCCAVDIVRPLDMVTGDGDRGIGVALVERGAIEAFRHALVPMNQC